MSNIFIAYLVLSALGVLVAFGSYFALSRSRKLTMFERDREKDIEAAAQGLRSAIEEEGTTAVLMGPSGVGKASIVSRATFPRVKFTSSEIAASRRSIDSLMLNFGSASWLVSSQGGSMESGQVGEPSEPSEPSDGSESETGENSGLVEKR